MLSTGYALDSRNRSGIGLVGRSPWTAADAPVRLLAGRPGGQPRARAPAPHGSTDPGYLSQVHSHLLSIPRQQRPASPP